MLAQRLGGTKVNRLIHVHSKPVRRVIDLISHKKLPKILRTFFDSFLGLAVRETVVTKGKLSFDRS
jgi:hypothetical protein